MRAASWVVVVAVALACGRASRPGAGNDSSGAPADPQASDPSAPAAAPVLPSAPQSPDPSPSCPIDAISNAPAPIDVTSRVAGASASAGSGASCDGIAPPPDVEMQQYRTPPRGIFCHSTCMPGLGDENGTLSFPQEYYDANCHGTGVDFVTASGTVVGSSAIGLGLSATFFQQPAGLAGSGRSYLGPTPRPVDLAAWDSSAGATGRAALQAQELPVDAKPLYGQSVQFAEAFATDPGGGVLWAGDLRLDSAAPFERAAILFTSDAAVRWGPTPLDSDGAMLGAGVDVLGRSLVLTDGSGRFGAGSVAAQWLDRDGTPMTCAFALLSGYAGTADRAWLEAFPLVGGGVAIQRVDLSFGRPPRMHAAPVAIVESGAARFSAPPAWMAARPDTSFRLVRGGRAYATAPMPATAQPCTQRVEVLAPDGTVCGARDYPIADGTCDTNALTIAADGTVIQQLPTSMETSVEDTSANSCTWRWWAGALR